MVLAAWLLSAEPAHATCVPGTVAAIAPLNHSRPMPAVPMGFFILFLRASPGAASPLSFIAIRLTEHMGVFLALAIIVLEIL